MNSLRITCLLILVTILSSCSQYSGISKRKYRKGFYTSFGKMPTCPQSNHQNKLASVDTARSSDAKENTDSSYTIITVNNDTIKAYLVSVNTLTLMYKKVNYPKGPSHALPLTNIYKVISPEEDVFWEKEIFSEVDTNYVPQQTLDIITQDTLQTKKDYGEHKYSNTQKEFIFSGVPIKNRHQTIEKRSALLEKKAFEHHSNSRKLNSAWFIAGILYILYVLPGLIPNVPYLPWLYFFPVVWTILALVPLFWILFIFGQVQRTKANNYWFKSKKLKGDDNANKFRIENGIKSAVSIILAGIIGLTLFQLSFDFFSSW